MTVSFLYICQIFLTALGLSLLAGPAGSFLLWRRLGFLAEVLCHGAVFGISLSLLAKIPTSAGILITVSLILAFLRHDSQVRTAIASYGMLALGIGLIQSAPAGSIADPESYLWGDILLTDGSDIPLIWGLCAAAALFMRRYRHEIIMTVFDPDLAASEGIPVKKIETICMYGLGIIIASAVKITGVLLFPALLVIPAATAGTFAASPAKMILWACIFAFLAVTGGIALAFALNIACGVAIIICALISYISVSLYNSIRACGMRSGR